MVHEDTVAEHAIAAAEERVLWYSAPHQDWDVCNGSDPHEVCASLAVTAYRMQHVEQVHSSMCTCLQSFQGLAGKFVVDSSH